MAKKKIKKFLKNAAKIGGAVMLGKALMGNKGTRFARPKRGTIDQMAMDAAMPGNLSADMGMKRKEFMPGIVDYGEMVGLKKGGRVGCGVAKKGFGKAMKKRRK